MIIIIFFNIETILYIKNKLKKSPLICISGNINKGINIFISKILWIICDWFIEIINQWSDIFAAAVINLKF